MVFTFLENALNLGIFTHVPPHLKLIPKFLSSHTRQKEVTDCPRQHYFEKLIAPTEERGGRNYDLFYQNSIRKA